MKYIIGLLSLVIYMFHNTDLIFTLLSGFLAFRTNSSLIWKIFVGFVMKSLFGWGIIIPVAIFYGIMNNIDKRDILEKYFEKFVDVKNRIIKYYLDGDKSILSEKEHIFADNYKDIILKFEKVSENILLILNKSIFNKIVIDNFSEWDKKIETIAKYLFNLYGPRVKEIIESGNNILELIEGNNNIVNTDNTNFLENSDSKDKKHDNLSNLEDFKKFEKMMNEIFLNQQ